MPPTPEQLKQCAIHSEILNNTVAYLRSCGLVYDLSLPEIVGILRLVEIEIIDNVRKAADKMEKDKDKKPLIPPPPSDLDFPSPSDN